MRRGAIILCGGKSNRMGRDKATLPFGPECMLQRVVRLIGEVIDLQNVVVVAASAQVLPGLPARVRIARDEHQDRGPLEGMAAGMATLAESVDAVYVTSCDVPLLVPAFVSFMFELLGDRDIAVPRDDNFHHPLAAVYRVTVYRHIQQLLIEDRLRPRFLFDEVSTREVPTDELRRVDPDLSTLMNLNSPEDYQSAFKLAGLPVEQ